MELSVAVELSYLERKEKKNDVGWHIECYLGTLETQDCTEFENTDIVISFFPDLIRRNFPGPFRGCLIRLSKE